MKMKNKKRIFICIFCWIVGLIVAYPIYWMIMASFMPSGSSVINVPILYPNKVTLESYIEIFKTRDILTWLLNTAIVSFSSTFIAIIISIFTAYSLARFRFKGKGLFAYIILMTQMIPATLLIIPLFIIFKKINLLNSLVAVIFSYTTFTIPLAVWILWGFFKNLAIDSEEAAMLDGCTRLSAFLRVSLPIALPGIAVATLLCFLEGWNEYILAYTLISGQNKWVISLGLYSFIGQFTVSIENIMATSVIATIPAIIIFIFLGRYLVSGLTLGGLKE